MDRAGESRERRGGVTNSEATAEQPTQSRSDVDDLLARVKERGFVTTGEIFAALPDLEPETAELAAIYAGIRAQGVEVVDEIAEELQREDERRAGRAAPAERLAPERRPPVAERPAANRPGAVADGDTSTRHARARTERVEGGSFDPVRMYLKEIGKIPLLTAEQEVTLAKRIEAGCYATERLESLSPLSSEECTSLEAVAV